MNVSRVLALASLVGLVAACSGRSAGSIPDDESDVVAKPSAGEVTPETLSSSLHLPPTSESQSSSPPSLEAVDAQPGQWSFEAFPATKCMNGGSAGIGTNLGSQRDKVLIYMEGGGACFDFITCLSTSHVNGFSASDLSASTGALAQGIFNRNDSNNPLKDWTWIFVPYCTGDVHAGNNPKGPSNRSHVGYANMTKYLERIVPTYASATRVVLAGSSAGGFGAAYNYDQVAQAFGNVPVDLLDDAGVPMSTQYLKTCLQKKWFDTWGLASTLPADCSNCSPDQGGLVNALPDLAAKYSSRRFGYISGAQDSVIRFFYGYGYSSSCGSPGTMSGPLFQSGLLDVRDNVLAGSPNSALFAVGGSSATTHTFLGQAFGSTKAGTTTLSSWISAFLSGASTWKNAGP